MKSKKKLSLKKQTVSHLDNAEMKAVRGGDSNLTDCVEAQCQSGTCVSCNNIPYTRKVYNCWYFAQFNPSTDCW